MSGNFDVVLVIKGSGLSFLKATIVFIARALVSRRGDDWWIVLAPPLWLLPLEDDIICGLALIGKFLLSIFFLGDDAINASMSLLLLLETAFFLLFSCIL